MASGLGQCRGLGSQVCSGTYARSHALSDVYTHAQTHKRTHTRAHTLPPTHTLVAAWQACRKSVVFLLSPCACVCTCRKRWALFGMQLFGCEQALSISVWENYALQHNSPTASYRECLGSSPLSLLLVCTNWRGVSDGDAEQRSDTHGGVLGVVYEARTYHSHTASVLLTPPPPPLSLCPVCVQIGEAYRIATQSKGQTPTQEFWA